MNLILRYWSLQLVFLLLSTGIALSQSDPVDSYLKRNLKSHNIPGLSIAIVKNHKIIKRAGYGYSNIELKSPAKPNTVYEIGSITKMFTAVAIMMLVQEGKIKLNDTISSFFPGAPSFWNTITIHHLLNHTSGIQNHVAVPGYLNAFKTNLFNESFPSQNEIIEMFYKLPAEFNPGETWAYDNTGYYLLGVIIEKVSGKTYWNFLEERIFKPLEMKNTRSTDTKPIVPDRASGYVWTGHAFQNQPVLLPFIGFSAGCILSTAEDMALWHEGLYSGRLLKQSSLELIWTASKTKQQSLQPVYYGYGWFIDNYRGHKIVQHSGGTPGFSSTYYSFPDDSLAIIILTNHADKLIDQFAIDIAGLYVTALTRKPGARDPAPQTTVRLRKIFSDLLEGKYDTADFSTPMNINLRTTSGKSFWQWFASFGKPGDFYFSDAEEKNDVKTIRYRVMLGENFYWFTFRLLRDGRIAQIFCA